MTPFNRLFGFALVSQIALGAPAITPACQKLVAAADNNPSTRGAIAAVCPGALAGPIDKKYKDFFERYLNGAWSQYAWDFSPVDFERLMQTDIFFQKFRWAKIHSLSYNLLSSYQQQGIASAEAFLAFMVRSLPCANGGWADGYAVILSDELVKRPERILDILVREEKNKKINWAQAQLSYCQGGARNTENLLARNFLSALETSWGGLKNAPTEFKNRALKLFEHYNAEPSIEILSRKYKETIPSR